MATSTIKAEGYIVIYVRNQPINETITVESRPYKRMAIIIPHYFSVNSLMYGATIREIKANSTELIINNLWNNSTKTLDYTNNIDAVIYILPL